MTRFPVLFLAVATSLLVAACDSRKPAGSGNTPPAHPAGEQIGDFPIGTELMKSILEENDERLAKMREDLERLRRELDRLEASPAQPERVGEIKRSMIEILDKQESDLRKLNDQAEDMRKAMDEEKN